MTNIVVLAEGRCMTVWGGIIMTCIDVPHNIVSFFRLSSCYTSVGVCVCFVMCTPCRAKGLQKESSPSTAAKRFFQKGKKNAVSHWSGPVLQES